MVAICCSGNRKATETLGNVDEAAELFVVPVAVPVETEHSQAKDRTCCTTLPSSVFQIHHRGRLEISSGERRLLPLSPQHIGGSPRIRRVCVHQGAGQLVLGEASLPGLQTAVLSLGPHMAFPLCAHMEREIAGVSSTSPPDPSPIGSGLPPLQSH